MFGLRCNHRPHVKEVGGNRYNILDSLSPERLATLQCTDVRRLRKMKLRGESLEFRPLIGPWVGRNTKVSSLFDSGVAGLAVMTIARGRRMESLIKDTIPS